MRNNCFFILIVFIILFSYKSSAQTLDSLKVKYNNLLVKAKMMSDQKKHAEAIFYYRKALEMDPEKRLPKFKIEDIKTLYSVTEFKEILKTAETLTEEKIEQKEKLADNIKEKEQIEQKKKEEQILKEKEELQKKIDAEIKAKQEQEIKQREEQELKVKQELDVKQKEELKTKQEADLKVKQDKELQLKLDNKAKLKAETEANNKAIYEEEQRKIKEQKQQELKEKQQKVVLKSDVPPDIEEKRKIETEKLIKKYPKEKTIEITDEKNKKTTRIVINKDNKINIYLKIEYNWGGVYYFVDNAHMFMNNQSISEDHFNRCTKLE